MVEEFSQGQVLIVQSSPRQPFSSIAIALGTTVGPKLKAKIWPYEYVDFGCLLCDTQYRTILLIVSTLRNIFRPTTAKLGTGSRPQENSVVKPMVNSLSHLCCHLRGEISLGSSTAYEVLRGREGYCVQTRQLVVL